MRKLKTALILLATLGLLILGAFMPVLIAAITDSDQNRSGTRDLPSIDFNVSDANGEPRSLSAAGKIALLRDGQMINITENEAAMTVSQVNAALEASMEAYIDAGIFEWFEYTAWNIQPKLCVDPDKPENFAIFWTVFIVNKNEPYQTLAVDIDDETGKIYSIRFDCYGSYSLDRVWERNAAVMDAFIHVYLSQLGFLDEQQNVEPNIVYSELDGEVLAGGLYFENEEYGLMRIDFHVTGTGSFWVYFPE